MATATMSINVFFKGKAVTIHPDDVVYVEWISTNTGTAFDLEVTGAKMVEGRFVLLGRANFSASEVAIPLSQIAAITLNGERFAGR